MGTRLYDQGTAEARQTDPVQWVGTYANGSQARFTEWPDGSAMFSHRPSKWDTWSAPIAAERADQ